MDHQAPKSISSEPIKRFYSVLALPPDDVTERLSKLMAELRSYFGGPEFDPHVTVVGLIRLTEADALEKFATVCEGLKAYNATVEKVDTGTFFYQCVYLLMQQDSQVMEAAAYCWNQFGYTSSTTYMPHLSILYGDLSDEDKKKAQEEANILDDNLADMSFLISRFALYEIEPNDDTLASWKKIIETNLQPN
ncbi:cyclic phosphodiesterase-like [Impatiens glandulifera]|uniref:cyclic phosphodiesterase-like n=1 Tax=Impatiens glandulifera TaxID=253017 RepID=UPI001FB0A12D|nr:cyclic phosphodiesterase-like [Impatiens glandulifera]